MKNAKSIIYLLFTLLYFISCDDGDKNDPPIGTTNPDKLSGTALTQISGNGENVIVGDGTTVIELMAEPLHPVTGSI